MNDEPPASAGRSPEAPQGGSSQVSRSLAWVILVVWLVATVSYGAWQVVVSDAPLLPKLLAFGVVSGVALLLLSVLLDRLKAMKSDPYREVQK